MGYLALRVDALNHLLAAGIPGKQSEALFRDGFRFILTIRLDPLLCGFEQGHDLVVGPLPICLILQSPNDHRDSRHQYDA